MGSQVNETAENVVADQFLHCRPARAGSMKRNHLVSGIREQTRYPVGGWLSITKCTECNTFPVFVLFDILAGILKSTPDDREALEKGISIFEMLYAALA